MVKVKSHAACSLRRRIGSGLSAAIMPTWGAAMVIWFLAVSPQAANAQAALQSTQIIIGAPAQVDLGAPLTVQALLTDSQGHPISKSVIYFTVQEAFLHESGDEVLGQAMTNGNGQAVATFPDDFSGTITLNAEFKGDAEYAPSTASTPISIHEEQQVYVEHVGVDIPGLNVPPVGRLRASIQSPPGSIWRFVTRLWPAMNGWPLAAALFLVWSNYLLAVSFVFRLAADGKKSDDPSGESRSSI